MGSLLYLILILGIGVLLWWVFRALRSSQGVSEANTRFDGDSAEVSDRAEADDRVRRDLSAAQMRSADSDTTGAGDELSAETEARWRQPSDPTLARDAAVATSAPEVFAGDEGVAASYLGVESEMVSDAHDTAPPPSIDSVARPNDQIVVARLGSPQLLLTHARQVLDGLAEEVGVDFADPDIRALDGGGAAMALPVGSGAESALYVLDLLRSHTEAGPQGIDGEAWIAIRAEDQFLFVSDARANAELDAATAEVEAHVPNEDPDYGEILEDAISARLAPLGLPFGTRLYAYTWVGGLDAVPRLMATSVDGESFEISWDNLAEPRLRALDRMYRPYVDLPQDVREALGL